MYRGKQLSPRTDEKDITFSNERGDREEPNEEHTGISGGEGSRAVRGMKSPNRSNEKGKPLSNERKGRNHESNDNCTGTSREVICTDDRETLSARERGDEISY